MTNIREELKHRILILDGAMGTMLQRLRLSESDFRGSRFADNAIDLRGNNDILNLTCPDAIYVIHRKYIDAGADIISTNSFNANAISQTDYNASDLVSEINIAAAKIARKAVEDAYADGCNRHIWIAGSVGPTNRTASISPKMDDLAFRNITYDNLLDAYTSQVKALVAGGCDIILLETVFDTLNLKAALDAVDTVAHDMSVDIPVMVSATIAGQSGRILSGQTIEALWVSISGHHSILSFGLNCSWGAKEMKPYIVETARLSDVFISCHPNAGLPDESGNYKENADQLAADVEEFLKAGAVNIIGGCCGTTPEHISKLRAIAGKYPPHSISKRKDTLYLSGLDAVEISSDKNFVNIGERCNVAGSRKFLRLIKEKNYDEALSIARKQVEDGAQIIDINMDDAMIDAAHEMVNFLNLIASDPDTAKVPVMIDSSDWNVICEGLKCVQGKCIVNSISLKEGENRFIEKAKYIHRHGAAVVVMAFDETGQADTFQRKIEICSRAYKLLVENVGFKRHNIIFDPNVMAVATGIDLHDLYGRDFIRAVKWIKDNLPGAKTSGGVSNLSFAFRGHNQLREAIHAVFLYYAIEAGLDMGIVNPAASVTFEDIDETLREMLRQLLVDGSHDAAAALSDYANEHNEKGINRQEMPVADRTNVDIGQRLTEAIIKGNSQFLNSDLEEAALSYPRAIDIIEGPLMDGVNRVGQLFGEGKMFLPQVVKTARVMKQAVDLLKPRINAEKTEAASKSAGKILFATVKGDVHDIGKNIVAIVLECNNYEVIDLGVMVPAELIIETAIKEKPDLICLSGLITPSLGEMVNVADKLEDAGLGIPLIVGGATTSKLHTALKIAPHLSAPVVHASDASQNPVIASKLLNPATRDSYVKELNFEYSRLRDNNSDRQPVLMPLDEARRHKANIDWHNYRPTKPRHLGCEILDEIDLTEIIKFINWRMFFHAWKLTGDFLEDFPYCNCEGCRQTWQQKHRDNPKAAEALKLFDDAQKFLAELLTLPGPIVSAAIGIFEAHSSGDNIIIGGVELPMLRRQIANADGICRCAADYISPVSDFAGAFVVTAGGCAINLIEKYNAENDRYSALVIRTLLDRIAEAASEFIHMYVRREYWAYAPDEEINISDILAGKFKGIRPAMGYPMLPDQLLNIDLASLLPFDKIGVSLTENGAMNPPASVCGIYISHPDASYFMIETIGEDQLLDYSSRRNIAPAHMRSIINKNI